MALQDVNNYVVVPAGTAGNTAIMGAPGRWVSLFLGAAVATAAIAIWDGPVNTGTLLVTLPVALPAGFYQVNLPFKTSLNVAGAATNVAMTFGIG